MATATEYKGYQFAYKAFFWLASAVGSLFAGMAIQKQLDWPVRLGRTRAEVHSGNSIHYIWLDVVELRDGSKWQSVAPDGPPSIEAADDAGITPAPVSGPHLHIRHHAGSRAAKARN